VRHDLYAPPACALSAFQQAKVTDILKAY